MRHVCDISSIDCYQNIPNLKPCFFSCTVWNKKQKNQKPTNKPNPFYLELGYQVCLYDQAFLAKPMSVQPGKDNALGPLRCELRGPESFSEQPVSHL